MNKSGTVFSYQNGPFSEIIAHDNGYIYGRPAPGHVHQNMMQRLDRPRHGPEWQERQERRLITEWVGGES